MNCKEVNRAFNKALILDRDGIVNQMIWSSEGWDSPRNLSELKYRPAIFELIREANRQGFICLIATNQPGAAKHKTTIQCIEEIHQAILADAVRQSCRIEQIYVCYHHPDGKDHSLKKVCDCRKPKPGMLLQAIADYHLEPASTYFVGDRIVDVQAGHAAGCKTILLQWDECDYIRALQDQSIQPDYSFRTLDELIDSLKKGGICSD